MLGMCAVTQHVVPAEAFSLKEKAGDPVWLNYRSVFG